jgi:hypothetical protein
MLQVNGVKDLGSRLHHLGETRFFGFAFRMTQFVYAAVGCWSVRVMG